MSDISTYVTDTLQHVRENIGQDPWFTAYQWQTTLDESDTVLLWCQLVPESEQSRALAGSDQLQEPTFGQPGFVRRGDGSRPSYFRFGDDTNDEPLVIRRDYYGLEPKTLDISQEFSLFHNLFRESNGNRVKFDDAGNKEPVVRYEPDGRVLIRTLELKQYLAAKAMVLIAHFDFERTFTGSPDAVGTEPIDQEERETDLIFWLTIKPSLLDSQTTIAMMYGNKVVRGCALEECGQYPFEKPRQHESFQVSVDQFGHPILKEADTSNLSTSEFLVPVFFNREVLVKYQNNSDRYTISDGFMQCAGLWSLRMDNDRTDYVVVLLGDLGRLPYSEQKYWRSFNVPPDGTLSDTALARGVLGQFAGPMTIDLVFKQEFETCQQHWSTFHGWNLFRPLPPGDQYCYGDLGIPLTDSQREFDAQVGGLTKVLIDSLNDKELESRIKAKEKDMKSIRKLEVYLQESGATSYEQHITFLHQLQDVPSHAVAHIKDNRYEKELARLCVNSNDRRIMFGTVLSRATDMIRFLQSTISTTSAKT